MTQERIGLQLNLWPAIMAIVAVIGAVVPFTAWLVTQSGKLEKLDERQDVICEQLICERAELERRKK